MSALTYSLLNLQSRSRPFDLVAQSRRVLSQVDLPECGSNGLMPIQVKGKSLADSMEALIGIHCLTVLLGTDISSSGPIIDMHQKHATTKSGSKPDSRPSSSIMGITPALSAAVETACNFMLASGILPKEWSSGSAGCGPGIAGSINSWAELRRVNRKSNINPREEKIVESVETIVNYRFRSKDLVLQAVTHCSYQGVLQESYQRLEFIGDAVLGLIVTSHVLSEG